MSFDQTLKVWDLGKGELVRTLGGHTSPVINVTVTADGRWALSTSEDMTLRVWDLKSYLTVALLESHAPLWCCAVASDQVFLAGDSVGGVHIVEWIPPHSAGLSRAPAPRPLMRPAPELPGKPR